MLNLILIIVVQLRLPSGLFVFFHGRNKLWYNFQRKMTLQTEWECVYSRIIMNILAKCPSVLIYSCLNARHSSGNISLSPLFQAISIDKYWHVWCPREAENPSDKILSSKYGHFLCGRRKAKI